MPLLESRNSMGDVSVRAHCSPTVRPWLTTICSLPLTGFDTYGPHGAKLVVVSQRATPLVVHDTVTVPPRGTTTMPSCPLILTSTNGPAELELVPPTVTTLPMSSLRVSSMGVGSFKTMNVLSESHLMR